MKLWPPFRRRKAVSYVEIDGVFTQVDADIATRVSELRTLAARELGRLGGQAIGARRHLEAAQRDHAQHERVKAVARRMRADFHLPPKPILEPADFNEGA